MYFDLIDNARNKEISKKGKKEKEKKKKKKDVTSLRFSSKAPK